MCTLSLVHHMRTFFVVPMATVATTQDHKSQLELVCQSVCNCFENIVGTVSELQ